MCTRQNATFYRAVRFDCLPVRYKPCVFSLLTANEPGCASDAGTACALVWNSTQSAWLANNSDVLLVKPLRILMIIAICLLVRGLVNRTIKKLVTPTEKERAPAILRPLRERVPNLMADADTRELLGNRRRQRAQTIGSVLRSMVTWLVYAVMAMLVLAELNVNLGPLLASAGVVGLAIGFGAQALVKDILSGLFMIMEDQYGVGDVIDVGEATGTVEVVGLRVTTIRDMQGALWYVRNGEITRVSNQSQSWAKVVLDVPIQSSMDIDTASQAITTAATQLAEDPRWRESILEAPHPEGIVELSVDATVFRVSLKSTSNDQWALGRELRRRVFQALRALGVSSDVAESQVYVEPPSQTDEV